jgi:anthranilate phosphoribosyltransferase
VDGLGVEEEGVDLPRLIEKVVDGEDLTALEAEGAFDRFMAGTATEAQMAGLLVALRAKGVRPVEVAGGVRALRRAMVPVEAGRPGELVDTAGTGGGRVTTFNISTAAALVAAGDGVRIAKHGNRSFTSRSGSADVLEALGVKIALHPERMGEILDEVGIVFMFAPLLHPAMRHVGPVRRELGIATVMNILGPLTNPAGARRQVIGVADPSLVDLLVGTLAELGHIRAMVVHGEAGMDEISPSGVTRVAELSEGRVRTFEVAPESVGLDPVDLDALQGGEPEDNAEVILSVLRGESGAPLTVTLLNAAAAICVSGAAPTLAEGVTRARASVDEGRAMDAYHRLRDASNR